MSDRRGGVPRLHRGPKLRWSERAFADFKHRIQQLPGRSWGVSMAYRRARLARYLRGGRHYFGSAHYYRPIPALDPGRRRRIRLCYWKPGRRVRTQVGHPLALGTGKRQALLTALRSKR